MADTSLNDCRVRVLVVSPIENDVAALSRILGHSAWAMERARSVSAAKRMLSENPACVVLCEETLADGDWKDLYSHASRLKTSPLLIVLSKNADDHLWAEVLNLGAYDVLAKPLLPQEVYRVIGSAWRHWMNANRNRAPKKPARSDEPADVTRRATVGTRA